MNIFHVRREIAGLPIIVVYVVMNLVIPERAFIAQHLRQTGQRADVHIKLVGILRAPIERNGSFWWELRILLWFERTVEDKIGSEHERTTVIGIIAHEEIGHGRLWGRGFQRGMRIDDAG